MKKDGTVSAEVNGWRSTQCRFPWQHNSLISCSGVTQQHAWVYRMSITSHVNREMHEGWWQRKRVKENLWWLLFSIRFIRSVTISFFCVICRLSSDVLPGSWLMPCGETRACLRVSWRAPGHTETCICKQANAHTYILSRTHKYAQTKISNMSSLPTPPPILYLSLWDLKHGNPISLDSFLGKDTLHEACGNLLISLSLTRVVLPWFVHRCSVS